MHSTVAERPAPREKEQMKFRVNNPGFYTRSAWLVKCHDSSFIIIAKWVRDYSQLEIFDGGMISKIIRWNKVYPRL